jgi:hypothetical protein
MKENNTPGPDASPTTRRHTLQIMVAATTLRLPILVRAAPQTTSHATDATTAAPAPSYVLKYFNAQQARTIEAMSEVIIPADDHSGGAAAAKVYEYIDEIVSFSAHDVKTLWIEGLAEIDRLALNQYGQQYAKCTALQQVALMETISRNEEHPTTPDEKFFMVLKAATIDGYYTSSIGIHQDLEYQGNTMVLEFPGCTHGEHGNG